MKKEKNALSFSYLDVFLILVLFLLFSFAVYRSTENARAKEQTPDLLVSLSAYAAPEELFYPQKGEVLYRENGEVYGTVLSVETKEVGSFSLVVVTCKMQGVRAKIGDAMRIETPSCVREMSVFAAEKFQNSQKGGS